MVTRSSVSPIRREGGWCAVDWAMARLAFLVLLGVGAFAFVTPAAAQDAGGSGIVKVALLLEPQTIESTGASQVSEDTLAGVYGKGGVSSPSNAPAYADASSVTLWDEYLPKRTSNSGAGGVSANAVSGLNVNNVSRAQ